MLGRIFAVLLAVLGVAGLVWAQAIQTFLLGVYLLARDRAGLVKVVADWRVSSVASLARSVVEPAVVDVCRAAVTALDPRGSGLFCIDLKADAAGVPHVTDVNVGRFSLTTGLYDLIGKHSTAEVYLELGLGRPVEVADPYDIAPDHYLVRDVDTVPSIVHAEQLFEGITDLR